MINIPEIGFENRQKKSFEFEIISNRVFFLNKADDEIPFRPHRISFYGILFTLEGEGFHFIDFKKYPYKKGSVIFLSKEQVHGFERNENRDAYLLTFTEKFLEKSQMAPKLTELLSLFNYHLYSPVLQTSEEGFALLKGLVSQMRDEFARKEDVFSEKIIHSLLKIFLCFCERIRRENQSGSTEHFYKDEFEDFQKLLKEHILETRRVQFYADEMGCSTKKLNRITYKIIQQPAKHYINQMLVLEIKRFLMNTSLSIKEISFKCHFEAPTNFVKYFKTHTGLTPKEFRKQFL